MKTKNLSILVITISLIACKNYIERKQTDYQYHDIIIVDSIEYTPLYAVTNEENLQYGSDVAYLNINGDTVIQFGKFAYFGTDTMNYYANVILHPNDSTFGRLVGIDRNENILFDLVTFDILPDPFNEGLVRVKRNGKMGYANEKGEITIPCQYAYAKWFLNGQAKVTFEAREYLDMDEHLRVESDSWFKIDIHGNPIDE